MKRRLSLIALLFAASCTTIISTGFAPDDKPKNDDRPKNVVFFISDGCGPASFGLAREFQSENDGIPQLDIDRYHRGSVITFSNSGRVTDSAASATAYACAIKTYNGAIGMNPNQEAVQTILEMAEEAGFNTGLVTTARLTHATPAAFSSHVIVRAMEHEIASQQLEQGIEILMGGGYAFFSSPEDGGNRPDSLDLIQRAVEKGYHHVTNRSEMMANDELPMLAMFTPGMMAYEIDRDPEVEPSIAEMTVKSLELLAASDKPFFIMIEAGRIDHAGHANDPAAHLHDVLAYDEAWQAAVDFAKSDGETLIVGTSDHETGGLTLGAEIYGMRGSGYAYDPRGYLTASSSIARYIENLPQRNGKRILPRVGQLAADMVEIFGASGDTAVKEAYEWGELKYTKGDSIAFGQLQWAISRAASAAARVGWSTSGHTAVNVPLFAFGPGSESFAGVMDNTDIGEALRAALGLK